jgi:hypothetical protein
MLDDAFVDVHIERRLSLVYVTNADIN